MLKFSEGEPREYLVKGEMWPDGKLVDDVPFQMLYAQYFSVNLRDFMNANKLNINKVNLQTSVSRRVIKRILDGETLPGMSVIARIETSYGVILWPAEQIFNEYGTTEPLEG